MEEEQSVHLQNFPKIGFIVDVNTVNKMDKVRSICNLVFSLRKDENIRVRMPLKKIVICGNVELEAEYLNIIKQETNTKEIEIFDGNINDLATQEIVLDMKECGKRFGAKLKNILIAQKEKHWSIENNKLLIAGEQIEPQLFKITYKSKDGLKAMHCEEFNLLVLIDTSTNEDLVIEGLARDVIRIIQQTRKDNGLEINDRITAKLFTKDDIFDKVIKSFNNYICEQTLANNITIENTASMQDVANKYNIDNYCFAVSIIKCS